MPKLPSGKIIALSGEMIGGLSGPCRDWPEGHFSYRTPNLKMNAPPFGPDDPILCDFVHAPVPKSREEAMKYVQVLFKDEEGEHWWRGDWLSDFPKPGDLEPVDLAFWNEWLNSVQVEEFLDRIIELCRWHAEQNKEEEANL